MNRLSAIALTSATCIAGSLTTYAVMEMFGFDKSGLIFVIGAILGTQAAAWMMAKHYASPPMAQKVVAGVILAATTLIVGLALNFLAHPFVHPQVVIGVSTGGAFLFPLGLTETFTKRFAKVRQPKR